MRSPLKLSFCRHAVAHRRYSLWKWLKSAALILVILIGGVSHPLPTAQAANGNPAVIGPLPAGGVIRVYVQQNVADGPRVTVRDGAAVASHDGSGVINLLSVKTGDTIQIYVGNLGHGGQLDPGWEPPPGAWWCGHNGEGDGIKGFGAMEAAAEAAGAPIVSRQCWEDWGDGGYEDVTVIVTYDPATVDSTPPTTTASLAGTAGLTGAQAWYVSPVQVSLSASDPDDAVGATYLDGAGYGGPKTYSGQGQNSFTYHSVDTHGNSEAPKSGDIWIDTVAPSASSSLAGTVGLAGWYVSAVQVSVNGADTTSGINALELDGSAYSGPATFSALGATSYTYRAQDGAGNWSAVQNGSFKIDTDQPSASSSLVGTLGLDGWYVLPVQITLSGADATSGLGALELNGTAYTGPATIGTQGTVNYTDRARDVAGNWSVLQNGSFKIDTVAPTVTPAFSGLPGSSGWYRGPVQVALNGVDATSGMGALELNGAAYAPLTVSAEGVTSFTYRGQDQAGSWSALQTGMVQVDSVAPVTTASLTGTAGLAGWYTTPVQVTLSSGDVTSGVGSVTLDGVPYAGPRTYADGTHALAFFAMDNAGNAETSRTVAFNVDTIPPSISDHYTGTLGLAGWYVSPVTITLSGADATSGLGALELNGAAYAGSVLVSAQGTTNYTYRGQDQAGNWSSLQSGSFQVDTLPPITTAALSGTLGLHNIYVTPLQVVLNSADANSGVGQISLDGTPYTNPRVYTDGVQALTYSAVDVAGNAEAPHTMTFTVDTQTPQTTVTVTGPKKDSGWYTGDVTVRFTTSPDAQVYVDGQLYAGPLTFTDNGRHTLHYHAVDRAGNTEVEQTLSFGIDRDAPDTSGSATVGSDGMIALDINLSDAVSGVRDGGIYVMSVDWQVLKVFPFSSVHAHFDWDGRLDSGDPAPPGYFLLFYARDRAGNEVYRQLAAPTTQTTVATPAPSSTWVPTRQRTPTPRSSATPGEKPRRATETPSSMATPSPTLGLPPPPKATYPPLPTPTRLVEQSVMQSPLESRLGLWLVALSLLCLGAMLLAASLAAHPDPRPPAVRRIADVLQQQLRFTLED